jgi:KDO2-lipid IV(A) lauroyltransferase
MDTSPAVPLAHSPRWYSHRYNRGGYYWLAALSGRALPRAGRHALAGLLARLARRVMPLEWESVRRNLGRVRPEASPESLAALTAGVFRNFGRCFSDLVTLNSARAGMALRYVESVCGEEHLARATREGRGLIVATAHLGNWELGGRLLAAKWGRPTHVVLAREEDPSVEKFLRRNSDGVHFVTRAAPTSSLALLAALRRNEVVAFQGDRATGGRADLPARFFGAPALFPIGPFLLARATGAPVLPAFCVLVERSRYRIFLEPPIWVGPGDEETGLKELVAAIERYVSTWPDQWFNFYNFWDPPCG